MANARTYVTLKNLVRTICQDESATGQTNAGNAINQAISQIQMEIDYPGLIKGEDSLQTITTSAGSKGTVEYTLNNDVSHILNIWYVTSGITIKLIEVTSHIDWLSKTALAVSGTPLFFMFIPPQGSTSAKALVWPAPDSSFVSFATNLKYSYIQQFSIFVNDGTDDSTVPALPYAHDKILISGGVFYMAMMQGDDALMKTYGTIFANDMNNLRAWYTAGRFTGSNGILPADPLGHPTGYGTISKDYGRLT